MASWMSSELACRPCATRTLAEVRPVLQLPLVEDISQIDRMRIATGDRAATQTDTSGFVTFQLTWSRPMASTPH